MLSAWYGGAFNIPGIALPMILILATGCAIADARPRCRSSRSSRWRAPACPWTLRTSRSIERRRGPFRDSLEPGSTSNQLRVRLFFLGFGGASAAVQNAVVPRFAATVA